MEYYAYPQSNPMQEIAQEERKAQIRVTEAAMKNAQKDQIQAQREHRRIVFREIERQARKAQMDTVSIDTDGQVIVQTQNLTIQGKKRFATNFTNPEIIVLERLKDSRQKLYLLQVSFNEKIVYTILRPDKCGNSGYLLRKIGSFGGMILGASASDQKNYALQLFCILIQTVKETLKIPDEEGWYIDADGIMGFWDRELTWKEAEKWGK